jgi:hypothetical protein
VYPKIASECDLMYASCDLSAVTQLVGGQKWIMRWEEEQESPLGVTSTGLAQDLISCISTRSLELGNPELTAWRPFDFNHEYKVWKVLKLSVTHSERKIQIEFM